MWGNMQQITHEHGCSPVNLQHILRTLFTKNTSGRLLLWRFIWKKNILSTVDPSYNELWRGHGILFDIIAVRKWVKNIRKLRFSQFSIFFLYCVCFKIFILSLFLFMVAILQRSNKWRRIKYLVRTQISVLGNFIFWRSNNSSVPNKQTWNLKIDRLVGSS